MSPRILAIITACSALALGIRADNPKPDPKPKVEAKRVPWTTSKITGSPEPPPKFKSVRVFPKVKFDHPLLIARCPGTDRLFIGEEEGKLLSVKPGTDETAELFFDSRREIQTLDKTPAAKGAHKVYGLAFHPKFDENRYCYVCYTLIAKDPKANQFLADGTRVSRFKVTKTDPPRIDPASEEIVITWQAAGHNGGDLHFGPDAMLYISTGDGRGPNPPDSLNTGQDCSDLLSSVLRIDVDRRAPEKNYSVPKDNPFVSMKDVRPEIWAFGFRNPFRMSFDRQTGDLWVGDVGWELWEMVQKVQKGGNYGWSITEGKQPTKPNQKVGPTPILAPTIELPHTIAASITGGYVYRGKKFPELVGTYIFGDWETRRIWAARFENGRVKEMPEIVKPNVRAVAFGEDHAGELYYVDYDTGYMYTLDRNDAKGVNTAFPTKLSETGLFKDVKKHEMAPGVVQYFPNARQWQDGATSRYYVALPGDSAVKLFDKPRPLPGQVFWHNFKMQFPKDAVLVKSIEIRTTPELSFGVSKRLETQLLHYDGEDWRGYTFAWRADNSDADLVPAEGSEIEFTVAEEDKPKPRNRTQVWTYHSRNQCMVCHNAWSEYTLAFTAPQLNTAQHKVQPLGKGLPNELVKLNVAGCIQRVDGANNPLPPFDETTVETEPRLVNPHGLDSVLNPQAEQARAYLHINCAHCHRFGGGGGQVVLELDGNKPLKDMGIWDTLPKQGDFGIKDAKIIAPGDPSRSVLYYRMAKFGRGRMPHLGSERPDWSGLRIIYEWIEPTQDVRLRDSMRIGGAEAKLTTVEEALPLAFRLGGRSSTGERRANLLAAAAKLEPGPVRDLFEGYLPPDPKGRKLGNNPRPQAILALKGDVKNGEVIFNNKDMKCVNCHKIGDKGVSLGPDLTAIGKTRTRAELLESLLQPSVRVEPQFAAYLVQTKDEKTFTGLLVKRDEKQVVLRDAENKEIVLAADNVESVRPSRLSMMPDGQMAGLLPQEAADLLEYLATRK